MLNFPKKSDTEREVLINVSSTPHPILGEMILSIIKSNEVLRSITHGAVRVQVQL